MPIIPPMERLSNDLKTIPRYARSAKRKPADFVLAVTECQTSIDRACERLKVQRFTAHDCRHLYATACVESGVDFNTLAAWLGHSDPSITARIYSHLRPAHSQRLAAQVTF